MYIFRSQGFRYFIAFFIGAVLGVLYFLSALAANADTTQTVSIAGTGQVIVKGARIVRVSDRRITAVSGWGASEIRWNVELSGTTRFDPASRLETVAEEFHVGDTIGFSGRLNKNVSGPSVYGAIVRNESVIQSAVTLQGVVLTSTFDTLLVQTETGTSTIYIGNGTIMTKNGDSAQPGDAQPGDIVRAVGTLDTRSHVLSAERVTSWLDEQALPDIPPVIPNEAPATANAWLNSIVAWVALRRGVLSVR